MCNILLKRSAFLASFFLSHASPLLIAPGWGMIQEEMSPTKQTRPKASLSAALEAYETGQDELAEKLLTQLAQGGALIPFHYLESLKKAYPRSVEPMLDAGLKLRKEFFEASEAYRLPEDKKRVEKLAPMITDGNAHALSLFAKLYEKDKSILKHLPRKHVLKNAKSTGELYIKFKPAHHGPILFWNCLDPNNLTYLYKHPNDSNYAKALKIFEVNYKKAPHAIGQIATGLAKLHPDQSFWSHLAVENGWNEGWLPLVNVCAEPTHWDLHERINFLEYYVSCIHKERPLDRKETAIALRGLGDIFAQLEQKKREIMVLRLWNITKDLQI